MGSSVTTELNSIKSELTSIIGELESISSGVRSDFTGIGNDKCADCIDKVVSQYYGVYQKLNSIDTNSLSDGNSGGV